MSVTDEQYTYISQRCNELEAEVERLKAELAEANEAIQRIQSTSAYDEGHRHGSRLASKLRAECDEWQRKFEDLKVSRASCCMQMEDERDAAHAEIAALRALLVRAQDDSHFLYLETVYDDINDALSSPSSGAAYAARVQGLVDALERIARGSYKLFGETIIAADALHAFGVKP